MLGEGWGLQNGGAAAWTSPGPPPQTAHSNVGPRPLARMAQPGFPSGEGAGGSFSIVSSAPRALCGGI